MKSIKILIAAIVFVCLAGCNGKEQNEACFSGLVEGVYEKSFRVAPNDDEEIRKTDIINAHNVMLNGGFRSEWRNAESIDVTCDFNDKHDAWTIDNKQDIAKLSNWFINLELEPNPFEKGKSPKNYREIESYTFNLNQPNGDVFSYTYGT